MSNLLAVHYLNQDNNIQVIVLDSIDYNETLLKEILKSVKCEFVECIQVFPDEVITLKELIKRLVQE